jgi:hypothetical protein
MDYLHGPKCLRRFRSLGLETIPGRELLTTSLARSMVSFRIPAGSSPQDPKQYIAQFADSGRQRTG